MWGSRKLEDNWRRINKSTIDTSEFSEYNYDEEEEGKEMVDSLGNPLSEEQIAEKKKGGGGSPPSEDPHFPDFYLKQIPKTDEEKTECSQYHSGGLVQYGYYLER